ncbi:nitroreductase family protein [Pseudodesulfovibrio sp. JC047]|uniref:nitroreductase family protein n=1 Tax=Pseudodesulfovibrio sp. JC047 TaxID=2683199 RepID=UPI0013D6CF18|nr:nitroreductase family protein [Pseudodesulfovibrio sp. JC047]NDV19902.1 nitroreductase family protein [Pseudodesulfovibrio sp. JC047]
MDFGDILIKRRAINFFDPTRDISDQLIRDLLEEAVKAPSSFNLQPWKVKILRDPETKAQLRSLAFDQPKVTEAPVILMILADRDGWKEGSETLEKHFANNLEPEQRDWFIGTTQALYGSNEMASQAFANKNAGLFAMSLMYAASNHGLHTHPMDGFDHDAVKKAWNIPDRYWISMLIAVGHLNPGTEVHPKAWRQSAVEMILEDDDHAPD